MVATIAARAACVAALAVAAVSRAAAAATHVSRPAGGAPRPNVLHIIADDLGWNEMSWQNVSRGLITPNLAGLAKSGVILKNFYVQPICSPTRSALMTGRYPMHLGTQSNVIYWDTPWGISAKETFLSNNLKDAGYSTALFGKWHLGMFTPAHVPQGRGFDEHVGFDQGCGSYWGHVAADCNDPQPPPPPSAEAAAAYERMVRETEAFDGASSTELPAAAAGKNYDGYDWWGLQNTIDDTANGTYSADLIRDNAVSFIKARAAKRDAARRADPAAADTPFYLLLPFQNVHVPIQCPWKFVDMYPALKSDPQMQILCGMITALDDAVGTVLAQLNASGFGDNLVVLFHSDNGAPPVADKTSKAGYTQHRNYPLRGWKTQLWEGGTRVPAFVHSDLLAPSVRGTENTELYHVTDILPTLVGLAGGSTKRNRPLDGHDIWTSLSTGAPSPRTEMLYNINPLCDGGQAGKPKAGVRQGDWKLLCSCYSWNGPNSKGECTGTRYLFNLATDPTESNNVAAANPKQVAALEARLGAYAATMIEPMQWVPPYQGKDYWCAGCPLGNQTEPYHAWRPWIKAPPGDA